jgi:hypothetical protein
LNCPKCGKELKNERGLRTHYSIVHNEPLENNTCDICGDEFYSSNTKTKTCSECSPFKGERNPNYKGATEQSTCIGCGKVIEYYPSSKDGKWCSSCQEKRPWVDEGSAPESPLKGNRKVVECNNCGSDIDKPNSEVSDKNYCSMACLSEHRSEVYEGEGHPNWEEGYTNEYTDGWWNAKQNVLRRDQYRCQKCGKSENEIGRKPDVHHIKPMRKFENKTNAHTKDNLICLCRQCHHKVESKDLSDCSE